MSNIKKVSISGIGVYAECPRKYMFHYVKRIYRASNQNFIFGTFGHKILEYISDGFGDDVIYGFMEQEKEKRSMQEALIALKITDLKSLTKNYIKIYRDFLSKYEVIETELMLEDNDHRGVIDLIAVDKKNHKLIILDNKFTNYAKTDQDILDNFQLYMYAKLLNSYKPFKALVKQYKIESIYLAYFSMSKIEIRGPKILAKGNLSKARDKAVTYDSYLKAIKDNDLNVEDYSEHLDKLKNAASDDIRYVESKLTRADLKEKTEEIGAWTKLIRYSIANNLFPGRDAFHCKNGGFGGKPCEIYKQCKNYL